MSLARHIEDHYQAQINNDPLPNSMRPNLFQCLHLCLFSWQQAPPLQQSWSVHRGQWWAVALQPVESHLFSDQPATVIVISQQTDSLSSTVSFSNLIQPLAHMDSLHIVCTALHLL